MLLGPASNVQREALDPGSVTDVQDVFTAVVSLATALALVFLVEGWPMQGGTGWPGRSMFGDNEHSCVFGDGINSSRCYLDTEFTGMETAFQ